MEGYMQRNFCEGCPMRGDVQNELFKGATMPVVILKPVEYNGIAGIIVDKNLNPSEPFKVEGEKLSAMADAIADVRSCSGPTEKASIFRKLSPQACPALGQLAFEDGKVREGLFTMFLDKIANGGVK